MRDGFRIIDADRHVVEPMGMWREYLEPAFRPRAPYLARLTESLPMAPMLEGHPVWHKFSERAQLELSRTNSQRPGQLAAAGRPEGHLTAMEQSGVDVSFLYPTFAMYLMGIDGLETDLAVALARAYNRWLHDFCRADPQRLRGVGLVSPHEPGQMVTEAERIAAFGWTVVVLRPNPIQKRLLSAPAYEPFWAACERLGLAVAIHEGTHARAPTAGADRFESRFALHACSHPMEQMMALLSLIEGGVLERHPTLRVGFLEAGCGWLPYWLWRLDAVEYANLANEVAEQVRMEPSRYFLRQGFVAFEPEEPYLLEVLRLLGDGHLLFGTDFPHLDHDEGIVARALALRGRVPDEVLRKLLWDNAARFYGLESRSP
jgi:predicted TIM-barrel fold metal-dependent hydrolase